MSKVALRTLQGRLLQVCFLNPLFGTKENQIILTLLIWAHL